MTIARPTFLIVPLALTALLTALPNDSFAAPSSSSIKARAKAEARTIKKLRQDFLKLSLTKRRAVIAALTALQDSDEDGVADLLEPKTGNVCDPDSDDDGLGDGDEYRSGTNPNKRDSDGDGKEDGEDDDSDGDGQRDSSEVEFKGILTVGTDPFEGTVGTIIFRVDGDTRFRRGDTISGLTLVDFAGRCVEVAGKKLGDTVTADEVKEDDDC